MTNTILILILIAVIAAAAYFSVKRLRKGGGCCGEHAAAEKRVGAKDRDPRHYPHSLTLRIGGMTCSNCARRVENALNALDGTWARADIGTHTAKVRTINAPDEALLRRTVSDAGYSVLGMEADK